VSITDYELAQLKEQLSAQALEIARLNGALEERRAAFAALNQDDLRLSRKFLKLREELKEQTLEAEGWRLMSEQRAVELEMALDEKKKVFIKKDIKGWRSRCWRSEDAHELTKTRLERALAALREAKSIDLNYGWQADVDAILVGDGNV
jgi:chromosome segregation ATPase